MEGRVVHGARMRRYELTEKRDEGYLSTDGLEARSYLGVVFGAAAGAAPAGAAR
jgi:hypothetical protein